MRRAQTDADTVLREIVEAIGAHKSSEQNKTVKIMMRDAAREIKRIKGRHEPPTLYRAERESENYSGILEPSVAQPPLPLQEFLPLQPLSLDLQPPLPLQEFWPLQACFSFTFLSAAGLSVSWAVTADLTPAADWTP